MNRKEFEAFISSKAAQDEGFRKALLADPKGVISKALSQIRDGASIPDHVQVHVVEETPDKLYFVIPPSSSQLTEEQLAGVSGGASGSTVSVSVATVVTPVLDQGVAIAIISNPPPAIVVAVVA